jgi:hypothetical protein
MPYYMFYWYSGRDDDERFLARIEADSKTVKKLLDEYRDFDPDGYNNCEFVDFLKKHGIEAEIIEPDEWIYF